MLTPLLHKRYREFVAHRVLMRLNSEGARTYLSFLWWILEPALTIGVLYLVFGVLFPRGDDAFVAVLLVGVIIWQSFANSVNHGINSIQANSRIILSVAMPKEVFPAVETGMDLVKFAVVFVLLLAGLQVLGGSVSVHYLVLPLLIAIQFMLAFSLSMTVAYLVPFFPDLRFLVAAALQLTFFLSGVFYEASQIPVRYRDAFFYNPMAALIDSYRAVLLRAEWPDWIVLGRVGVLTLAICVGALFLARRLDHVLPRVLQP